MKRGWRTWSIRTRLGLAHAASVSLVLAVFAGSAYLLLWNELTSALRRELGREFEVVESSIDLTPQGAAHWMGGDSADEAEYEGEPIAAELWTPEDGLFVRTRAADRWADEPIESSLDWSFEGFEVARIRGERVLVLQGIHVVSGHSFLIRVFRSQTPALETMAEFAVGLLIAFLAALLVAIGTSRWLVTRIFLQPLAKMADRASRIAADRPGERLPIENPDDELGRLGGVINSTLSRFDEVMDRLRRFSADASHELRTPLTSMRTVGEIALRGEQSGDVYREVIGSLLEEVESLSRLLDSLLLLAGADEAGSELDRSPRPVLDVLRNVEEMISVLAEHKDQTIRIRGSRDLVADVDETVFRMALINLLDNAIKYGPEGGVIDVELSGHDEEIQIDVHDEGNGIAREHRDRIFDRFYRVDTGRSRASGGSGLGLAVARWAVEAHDGRLSVVEDSRGGTTFRICIPRSRG